MFIVYILQSLKDKRTYVRYTENLNRRLKQHNSGHVKSTKHRTPFKLLFKEEYSVPLKQKIEKYGGKVELVEEN